MLKILIADDHPIVRRGLKQVVSDTSDIIVAGEASSGKEALDSVWGNDYDVVIMDISMPGLSGLDTLREIKSIKPNLPVIILSIHSEEQYALRSFKWGASGYLSKEGAPDEMIKAIRAVAAGGRYVSQTIAEKLAFILADRGNTNLHDTLSNREYQVMYMIASGKTITEIAQELCLSVKTISTYRSRIMEKLKLRNNSEITRYAIQHNLIG